MPSRHEWAAVVLVLAFTLGLFVFYNDGGSYYRSDVLKKNSNNREGIFERLLSLNDSNILNFKESGVEILRRVFGDVDSRRLMKEMDATEPLSCARGLIGAVQRQVDRFPPLLYDLVLLVLRSMTAHHVKSYQRKTIHDEVGFHIRNVSTLRERMQQAQCHRHSSSLQEDNSSSNNSNSNDNEHHNESSIQYTKVPVAVCTYILRPHGEYIQEFMTHWYLMGASKVILYNGAKSKDSLESLYFRRVLEPFVQEELVKIVDWDRSTAGNNPAAALEDCVKENRREFEWIALVNEDEFLVIHEPHERCLNRLLRHVENRTQESSHSIGALAVHRRRMSPLGIPFRDVSKPLLDQFADQVTRDKWMGEVKPIVNTKHFESLDVAENGLFSVIHSHTKTSDEVVTVTFKRQRVTKGAFHPVSEDAMYIDMELREMRGRNWLNYFQETMCLGSFEEHIAIAHATMNARDPKHKMHDINFLYDKRVSAMLDDLLQVEPIAAKALRESIDIAGFLYG